ncbi:MAG TPA: amidase family protein, partial [Longimicrobiales bacterium]|nr:amidase family protein [Longimicrobiales bacterium]
DATHGPDVGAPFEIPPPEGPYLAEVERDPGRLRVAFTTTPHLRADVDPDCVRAVEDAAALLTDLGHHVEERAPDIDADGFTMAFLTMVAAELGADLHDFKALAGRKARAPELEPATWAVGLLAGAFSAREYATALRTLEQVGRQIGPFFQEYDVLLTPTLASPPPLLGTLGPSAGERRMLRLVGAFGSGRVVRAAGLLDEMAKDAFAFIPWTPVYNVTGHPAMSVPLWWNGEGLPVGVHVVARFGAEDVLLRLAGQLERARPWAQRIPDWIRASTT